MNIWDELRIKMGKSPECRTEKLTCLINKKRLESGIKRSLILKIKEFRIYEPSFKSIFLVVAFFVIFFIISRLMPSCGWWILGGVYQNLIAIYAGISVLIFALIIFIAQSSRDYGDKVRVLLKVSFIYPIVVATILGFFFFLWGNINFWTIFFTVIIGISVIFSISRLILVLLSKSKFFKEYLELLKDRFRSSIELAIDERIGNNLLIKRLKTLKYYYFKPDSNEFCICYSPNTGRITEIDLSKLEEFSNLLAESSKSNGYGYYENESKSEPDSENVEGDPSLGVQNLLKVNRKRYLIKKYKDKVDMGDPLIAFDRKLLNPKILGDPQKSAEEIFSIGKVKEFSDDIRLELSDLKDQFINAIKNENLGKIDESYKIYSELVKTFINLLIDHGSKYTFKQALKERTFPYNKWMELEWLSEDIRDIFLIGMDSNNENIINKIGFLPIFIAQTALEMGDPYIFQEFLPFSLDLYKASFNKKPEIKSFMIDRSWRYLKETFQIVIISIEEGNLEKEELIDYFEYILNILHDLLRRALSENDAESIKLFINAVERIIDILRLRRL